MTYYDKEFNKLGTVPGAALQIVSEEGKTKWMLVSPAEIEAILEILNRKEVEHE